MSPVLSTLGLEIAKGRQLGAAIGAFNVYNFELARAVIQAAELKRSPVFLQSNFANLRRAGMGPFIRFLLELAAEATVPVAVHLDHGASLEEVVVALRYGFTSVMFDGSRLPLRENIRFTREVVRVAHSVGVTVEGELGAVGGDEDRALAAHAAGAKGSGELHGPGESAFTDPAQAEAFVAETGVDILAVSVGNVHGAYKGEPKLDFDRLAEIGKRTGVPLALHGASGLTAADLKRAADCGVVKVNFNTDLRGAYVRELAAWLEHDVGQLDLSTLRQGLIDRVAGVVADRIDWLQSARLPAGT